MNYKALDKDQLIYIISQQEKQIKSLQLQIKKLSAEDNEIDKIAKSILDYLNKKAKRRFKYIIGHLTHIKARLKENYSKDDFILVIDKKCEEWLNTNMEDYLRPCTLFNSEKFDCYLNQKKFKKLNSIINDDIIKDVLKGNFDRDITDYVLKLFKDYYKPKYKEQCENMARKLRIESGRDIMAAIALLKGTHKTSSI